VSGVGRYVKFTAQPGRGDELAELLLDAAESLRETAGCELYLINRAAPELPELEPLGGVGYLPGGAGYTLVNLEDVEDMAKRFGLGDQGEARFANRPLHAVRTGLSHQRLRPGVRQSFGHRHQHAEEVFVVLAGSGRVRVDDDVRGVRPLDAIRIAPDSPRAFEAGPDGLEFIVVGPHHAGDAVIDSNFWPPEET
jgi:mannose-6-phosphate isomerase-like protein (cupin superfamily)